MLFTTFLAALLFTSMACATALPKRQPSIWESPFSGTILSPTEGQLVQPGADVPFEYDVSSWCEPAFAPFTVYLTSGANPPAFDNVTADGALADGAYVLEFGKFVVSRFGLPTPSPPPPTTLTIPTIEELNLDPTASVPDFFITVLEEFDGCPGDIAVEYSLTSVPINLSVSDL